MAPTPFWLGGLAACMASSCTHPLDFAKVRMQTIESAPGTQKPSILTVLRASIHESGIRSVYTGLTAAWMRQMSYSLVRLGTYEAIKERLSRKGSPSTPSLIAAASFAGGLGGIVGNPADIILVRMTSDSMRPPEQRYRYSNAITGLFSLAKEEGLRGLGRGIGTNTTRAVLMNASQVGSYDFFKAKLLRHSGNVFNYQLKDNLLLHVIASLLAGTFATTVCSPADVMRTRIMSSSSSASLVHVLTTSVREEGPRVLFRGWTPAFMRLGPNTVLLFVFFEVFLDTLCKFEGY
ncbi:mitochondrial carrier domain-containing protein [Favolaschia claudopus]|uniref:Mitochondrial carrier domain-containing protein n=1 Tax=Favolaschia claudopus TaxID=2862362 RepID=A0AAW0EKK4_9AGAR